MYVNVCLFCILSHCIPLCILKSVRHCSTDKHNTFLQLFCHYHKAVTLPNCRFLRISMPVLIKRANCFIQSADHAAEVHPPSPSDRHHNTRIILPLRLDFVVTCDGHCFAGWLLQPRSQTRFSWIYHLCSFHCRLHCRWSASRDLLILRWPIMCSLCNWGHEQLHPHTYVRSVHSRI